MQNWLLTDQRKTLLSPLPESCACPQDRNVHCAANTIEDHPSVRASHTPLQVLSVEIFLGPPHGWHVRDGSYGRHRLDNKRRHLCHLVDWHSDATAEHGKVQTPRSLD